NTTSELFISLHRNLPAQSLVVAIALRSLLSRFIPCPRRPPTPRLSAFAIDPSSLAMAAVAAEVCVKAAVGSPDALGDCKPSSSLSKSLSCCAFDLRISLPAISPEGKLPVLKLDDGKSAPDSDVITQILEEKFPNPSLVTPQEYSSV
ncbi:hypothetical protein GW17_00050547, partial [Ensete ventricosum]